ncbi:U32 family peptidase [Bacteroidales bacterium OttesenSCG-928-L19]|nr:U32 family peptidase [Bacteroidales bacterium OttesenSCG-928-L19]
MRIELLAPAKNLKTGIEAINHGADAVYIGADRFGARSAAGNSIADIEQLCQYAHQYFAKVYVTLNTILYDSELKEAEKMIHQLYQAGVDALIIQDMGILMMNIPPIPLHASTQTDNRTIEKVKFLKEAGFERVVLARELSLKEIEQIHQQCDIELEAFVHGALCVSYSGQCYISRKACERSANRGECAQYCRLPYQLKDADGNTILKNKHLLSLKDMNRAEHLKEMIHAGVRSFKIEGRLKEVSYVKNITAFYRQKLDIILKENSDYRKASSGKTSFSFSPSPAKSFNRDATDYFLTDKNQNITQFDTPKSIGEYLGKVKFVNKQNFTLDAEVTVANGDGLCFIDSQGELQGFRINKVEGAELYPAQMPELFSGTTIYRNFDHAFEKLLQQKSAERKISVNILFQETENGFHLSIIDEDLITTSLNITCNKEPALKPEKAEENIRVQFSKLGNTIFEVSQIDIQISQPYFFTLGQLSEWKREIVDLLAKKRLQHFEEEKKKHEQNAIRHIPFNSLSGDLTYTANVANALAEEFYKKAGIGEISPSFEQEPKNGVPVMFCKYCLKKALGCCSKERNFQTNTPKEPLYILSGKNIFRLEFDCKKCEMRVIAE